MDLEILNHRPERERTCRACNWTILDEDDPGPHSCRTAPAEPRSDLQERRRASARIQLDRELRIRRERLADLNRARA